VATGKLAVSNGAGAVSVAPALWTSAGAVPKGGTVVVLVGVVAGGAVGAVVVVVVVVGGGAVEPVDDDIPWIRSCSSPLGPP